jgi:hypothetical protein
VGATPSGIRRLLPFSLNADWPCSFTDAQAPCLLFTVALSRSRRSSDSSTPSSSRPQGTLRGDGAGRTWWATQLVRDVQEETIPSNSVPGASLLAKRRLQDPRPCIHMGRRRWTCVLGEAAGAARRGARLPRVGKKSRGVLEYGGRPLSTTWQAPRSRVSCCRRAFSIVTGVARLVRDLLRARSTRLGLYPDFVPLGEYKTGAEPADREVDDAGAREMSESLKPRTCTNSSFAASPKAPQDRSGGSRRFCDEGPVRA